MSQDIKEEEQVGLALDDDDGDEEEKQVTKRGDSSTAKTESDSNTTEEEIDDDNMTDFDTLAKHQYVDVQPEDGSFSLFGDAFCESPSTMECISHQQLRALLIQEQCSEGECVEVFFALLHLVNEDSKARSCGCIPPETFSQHFPRVAREKTKLDEETITAISTGDLKALSLSKKAS